MIVRTRLPECGGEAIIEGATFRNALQFVFRRETPHPQNPIDDRTITVHGKARVALGYRQHVAVNFRCRWLVQFQFAGRQAPAERNRAQAHVVVFDGTFQLSPVSPQRNT